MPFQTQVNIEPAIGVPGKFASNNPYATLIPAEGGLVAGAAGVTVSCFAWVDSNTQLVSNAQPVSGGAPDGFVFNDDTATIANILSEFTTSYSPGYMVTLMIAGDFYAISGYASTRGQKVFASTTDGTIQSGTAGSTVTGHVETEFYILEGGAAGNIIKIGTWK